LGPSRLMVEEIAVVLRLFRGELAEAIDSGRRALALRQRLGGQPYTGLDAALLLMVAYAARGDLAAVEPLFDQLILGVGQTSHPPADLPAYLFYVGRIRWLQGRLAAVREIDAEMCALMEKHAGLDYPENRICRAWMRSLLAFAEGRYGEAERTLRQPEVLEQNDRGSRINGCTRLMLARLYYHQKRQDEALAALGAALEYHERLGVPFAILVEGQSIVPLLRLAVAQGVHARYAVHLLDLLGADDEPRPVPIPGSAAALTAREVEVLELVAAGRSNRAIAEDLVISEWTVKSHLTKIYRKLDVASRTQAVVRAQQLGIA
ncbi:MAG: response regulator transcription factor, partial [Anaerolineae bacterium]|nr:response regulator transcription factor [Anaerolineae bacterium]